MSPLERGHPAPHDWGKINPQKLQFVIRNNALWIIALMTVTLLSSYLITRWTKDEYVSSSEIQLMSDDDRVLDNNIIPWTGGSSMNLLAKEIVQIKSKKFLSQIIDSLALKISYHTVGKVLMSEIYGHPPIHVDLIQVSEKWQDKPIYIDSKDNNQFIITDGDDVSVSGSFGQVIDIQGLRFIISRTIDYISDFQASLAFIINSDKTLLEYLHQNLSVEPANTEANTIKITFQDYNALKSFTIVQEIISRYTEYKNGKKNLAINQKIDWLEGELSRIERKIESFQHYFENYTLENKSSDTKKEMERTIFAIHKLDSQHIELKTQIKKLDTLLSNLSSNSSSWFAGRRSFLPNHLNDNLEKLYFIAHEKKAIALSYQPNTFTFKKKEIEEKSLKKFIATQLDGIKKEWIENLNFIHKKKLRMENKFKDMPKENIRYLKNERYYRLYETLYLELVQSKAQLEIINAGNVSDFEVLSPPEIATSPSRPLKLMIIGIGISIGFVLSFILISVLYASYNKIVNEGTIESSITESYLGSIPFIPNYNAETWNVENKINTLTREAFRTLRTNLNSFVATHTTSKVIAITSTISGEGKSFFFINLGSSIARANKKTLLVDLDMRKEKTKHNIYSVSDNQGVSSILNQKNDWKNHVIKTNIKNLDIILAGHIPHNPSELLLSNTFNELLEDLKSHYDFILLDTPPTGGITDGVIAMKKADMSIYLFRINYSKNKFIDHYRRILKIHNLKNVTVVTNGLSLNHSLYGSNYYDAVKTDFSDSNLST